MTSINENNLADLVDRIAGATGDHGEPGVTAASTGLFALDALDSLSAALPGALQEHIQSARAVWRGDYPHSELVGMREKAWQVHGSWPEHDSLERSIMRLFICALYEHVESLHDHLWAIIDFARECGVSDEVLVRSLARRFQGESRTGKTG